MTDNLKTAINHLFDAYDNMDDDLWFIYDFAYRAEHTQGLEGFRRARRIMDNMDQTDTEVMIVRKEIGI